MDNKKSFKSKIFIFCMIIVISICISFIALKYHQYQILMNIIEEINKVSISENYYYEVESPERGNFKLWKKDNYLKFQNVSLEESSVIYTNLKENKTYIVDDVKKEYISSDIVLKYNFINFPDNLLVLRTKEKKSAINIALSIKELKIENIDNIECYKIIYKTNLCDEIIWVNKENLLPIKCKSENNFSANYIIILNVVTDKDMPFSISEYKLLK